MQLGFTVLETTSGPLGEGLAQGTGMALAAKYLTVAALLKAGGRLADVDWHKRATDFGPPLEHRIAREDFLADAASAGLRVVSEPKILPYQYFVVLTAR